MKKPNFSLYWLNAIAIGRESKNDLKLLIEAPLGLS